MIKNDKTEKAKILIHDKDTLLDRLGIIIQGMEFKPRYGWVNADPSQQTLRSLLARGKFSLLPTVRTITQCPYLNRNLEAEFKYGYNAETEVFLTRDVPLLSTLPHNPSREEAISSLYYLRDFFKTFPFASETDFSVALSALLSAVNQVNLDNIPLHAFNAPAAGTGKSLLADVISLITTGKTISVMSQGKDEAETEKRLHSAMLAGDTLISLDNCDEPLGGDVLCQILTQPSIRIRPLGVSKLIDAEKTCMIVATGNNMVFEGDITRRTLSCELDAQMERPETRKFDFDIKERAVAERDNIIFHCMIIFKAHGTRANVTKSNTTPLGSFEKWSRLIRDPLVWLGMPNPVDSQKNIRATDPTLYAQQVLLETLKKHFGEGKFKTRDIMNSPECRRDQYLLEALDTLGCINRGEISTASVGKHLKKINSKIINGLQLIQVGQSGNAADWKVCTIG